MRIQRVKAKTTKEHRAMGSVSRLAIGTRRLMDSGCSQEVLPGQSGLRKTFWSICLNTQGHISTNQGYVAIWLFPIKRFPWIQPLKDAKQMQRVAIWDRQHKAGKRRLA